MQFIFLIPAHQDLTLVTNVSIQWIRSTVLTLNCRPRHFQSIFPKREPYLPGCQYNPPIIKKIMVDFRLQMKHLGGSISIIKFSGLALRGEQA